MRIWYYSKLDNIPHVDEVEGRCVRIGRAPENDIVLDSHYVPSEAAVLYCRDGRWELHALCPNVVQVGGETLYAGDSRGIEGGQQIVLFPYTLVLDFGDRQEMTEGQRLGALQRQWSNELVDIHAELLSKMDLTGERERILRFDDEYMLVLERNIEQIAWLRETFSPKSSDLVAFAAGLCCRGALIDSLTETARTAASDVWRPGNHGNRMVSRVPAREEELQHAVLLVAERLRLSSCEGVSQQHELIDRGFWAAWKGLSERLHNDFKLYLAQRQLIKEIEDILFGYGPLEDLLRTPTVSEIMVVDSDHIYLEKQGVIQDSGRRFVSDDVTVAIIQRIVAKVGRLIDKSRPLVDARLADGSRVNAIIPPLAVSGPCLTIRKFPERRLQIDDLVKKKTLTRTVAEFLRAAVFVRKNILIAGGTGTGKTTLLNCLSDYIPDHERIVTIEDTAELQICKTHVVRLETRESNVEGTGAYTIRDLVRNALRMRPDRIIVGECRGPEALDMLQAMNTGHDGSLTTIHANTPADVVLRLEVLVQMAADLPVASIHRQIASAIDLIVQLTRLRDGRRVISEVAEVLTAKFDGEIRVKPLFVLDGRDDSPELTPTGAIPSFMDELINVGRIRLETFYLSSGPIIGETTASC